MSRVPLQEALLKYLKGFIVLELNSDSNRPECIISETYKQTMKVTLVCVCIFRYHPVLSLDAATLEHAPRLQTAADIYPVVSCVSFVFHAERKWSHESWEGKSSGLL